ncbi:hypothetical protein MuYL_1795 [Mucilaginibacter xinganensis]|uniref:Uncharacterized protein n=1 Tax=Mucilaginibacter xinganensis TaxID=1234841 RepID=A0A223NVX0_9SPHI|nr:hypothetical protein MuYL_1795 [Mucilaginibacter xinganensis]
MAPDISNRIGKLSLIIKVLVNKYLTAATLKKQPAVIANAVNIARRAIILIEVYFHGLDI